MFWNSFTHLERLGFSCNVRDYDDPTGPPRVSLEELPTLRGSLEVSGFVKAESDTRFLDLLALFAKCKGHLGMLTFRKEVNVSCLDQSPLEKMTLRGLIATSQRDLAFGLSPCNEPVEIHARLDDEWFDS